MSIPKLKNLIELDGHLMGKPKRIGGVAVVSDGKVLMVRRSENAQKYPNFWAVPMGGVEDGETFREGAARELKEETMLDFNPKSLVYLGAIKDGKYNRFCKIYKAEIEGQPKPTLDHEHSESGYYNPKDLPHPIEDRMRQVLELNL
jgi:ADP-ribose pyrophosphatase YjhB (NUDIX family)|tara:strand:- start:56 stop:493 length:438 start_codon:yes stop_codon:yes gene_type:complete